MGDRASGSKGKDPGVRPSAETVERLRKKKQKAFRAWLDASNAWSALACRLAGGDGPSSGTNRKLRKLETRVEAAAEALEQILSHPCQGQDLWVFTSTRGLPDGLQGAGDD